MIDYLGMVERFHEKFNLYTQYKPALLESLEVRMLLVKLIQEEAQEFTNAAHHDIIEVADALADLLYVVFGAALAYGIPIEKVFEEVHYSNMTKSMLKDEKSIKGKTIKGPNYQPPNLRNVLFRGK